MSRKAWLGIALYLVSIIPLSLGTAAVFGTTGQILAIPFFMLGGVMVGAWAAFVR